MVEMISFIQKELRTKDIQDIFDGYLEKTGFPKKWIVLTDYCLDDPNKANVITFVLLHFKNEKEHTELEQKILKLQKSDIKHTRYISNRLMRYLRKLPVFSFSFILDKREILFGDTPADQRKAVTDNLIIVRDCFQTWLKTAVSMDIANYYQKSIKDLDTEIKKGLRPYPCSRILFYDIIKLLLKIIFRKLKDLFIRNHLSPYSFVISTTL